MKTIAQALHEIGLRQTAWLDQLTGFEKHGHFHPDESDPVKRYENPDGHRVKDWPVPNKVGPHAPTELNQVTAELAHRALDTTPDPANDLFDLNFVNGAGAYVLQKARERGLLDEPTGNKALDALRTIERRSEAVETTLPREGGADFQALLSTFKAFLGFVIQTAKAGGA